MNEAATRAAADAARLPLMLAELRLPTIKRLWPELAEQSNLVPSRQLFLTTSIHTLTSSPVGAGTLVGRLLQASKEFGQLPNSDFHICHLKYQCSRMRR